MTQGEVLEKVKGLLGEMGESETSISEGGGNTEATTNTSTEAPAGEGKSTFVLAVEDDKFLRELLVKKLTSEGFEVKSAIDSASVFEVLSGDEIPRIVLLDLILPGEDGFTILTKIKAESKFKDVPVLILSNLGQKEDIDKATELGAYGFMVKANFTLDEIVEKVRNILQETGR